MGEMFLWTRRGREELAATLNAFAGSLQTRMTEISSLQKDQLDSFAKQLSTLTSSNGQETGPELGEAQLLLVENGSGGDVD